MSPPLAVALAADRAPAGEFAAVATRLTDLAAGVASESEAATAAIRAMAEHTHAISALAGALEAAAAEVEASVRRQADALADARRSLADNAPVVNALVHSIESASAISAVIGRIAQQSQLLSLNARIEAARAGSGGGFAVVAREMSALSGQTRSAADEIGTRAREVSAEVAGVGDVLQSGAALVAMQDRLMGESLAVAGQQHRTAAEMRRITGATTGMIDDAASGVGRLGSMAIAVKVLAGQLARMAHD